MTDRRAVHVVDRCATRIWRRMSSCTGSMETDRQLTLTSSSALEIATPQALARVRLSTDVPHYSRIPRQQRLSWLSDEILRLNLIKHQKVAMEGFSMAQIIDMDATTLDTYIMEDAVISDFTLAEIDEAFKLGLVNRYGEYYGINAVSLYRFLEGYLRSPKKQQAIRIVRAVRETERRRQAAPAPSAARRNE